MVVRYLYGNRSWRSRESGVRADSRGAQEREGSGRATQAAARLSVVCVLYSGTVKLWCQFPFCVTTLVAVPRPPFPPARRSLGAPAACPPGRRGRWARRAPRHSAHWGCLGHPARCDTWVGGSADSATSPTSAAPSARRPAAPGAGSRSDRVSRLHGVMPDRGRRHIYPPAGCERGGGELEGFHSPDRGRRHTPRPKPHQG